MGDLINRQNAIDEVINLWADKPFGNPTLVEIKDCIEALPSAERKRGEWVPCSERLPQENGRYLVTRGLNACGSLWNRVYIVNYSDLMGLKKEKMWWDGNVGKSDFQTYEDVLAWMPLPEPYIITKDTEEKSENIANMC